MKDFNWEEFKKGNIEVHCETEELAKDFLGKCRQHEIRWSYSEEIDIEQNRWEKHRQDTIYGVWSEKELLSFGRVKSLYYGDCKDREKQYVKWNKESEEESTAVVKTKYSFEEVVINREPNQIWAGQVYKIIVDENGDLQISFKKELVDLGTDVYIDCTTEQYELEGVPTSLLEAIKECEENNKKRMKSLVTYQEYRISHGEFEKPSGINISGLLWLKADLNYEEVKGGWIVYGK